MRIPVNKNAKLRRILNRVNKDVFLQQIWDCQNKIAVDRFGYSDHGQVHVTIMANIALKLQRMLASAGVTMSCVKDHNMRNEDAEVIVFLASILHDIGHIVHRKGHAEYGIVLAPQIILDTIKGIYSRKESAIIMSEVLHAMICHSKGVQVGTVEGGIIRVADALDMEKGRSRIPFELGKHDIYSVSAQAVEDLQIKDGTKTKPIFIKIRLSNSAGIFQVDNLLKEKMKGSGIEHYVQVIAEVSGKSEKRIIKKFEI